MATTKHAHPTVTTDRDRLHIEVIGKRPENQPYVWIGNKDDGECLDSINERAMRRLVKLLTEALGD